MTAFFAKLWRDDDGALISAEYLFVATILVIGIVVGLTGLRNAINAELTDLGNAILALSQGFSIPGASGNGATVDGSQAIAIPTTLTAPVDTPPANPVVITVQPAN
jgi:Flp pilus assembly pilin Flp